MKLIRPGREPKWSLEASCPQCGAVLLIEEEDVICKYYPAEYADSGYYQFTCSCMACKMKMTIPGSKIDRWTQDRMKQRQ